MKISNQIKIRQMPLLPRNWNQSKQLTDKTYKNMQRMNDERIGSGSQTADKCKTDSIIVIGTRSVIIRSHWNEWKIQLNKQFQGISLNLLCQQWIQCMTQDAPFQRIFHNRNISINSNFILFMIPSQIYSSYFLFSFIHKWHSMRFHIISEMWHGRKFWSLNELKWYFGSRLFVCFFAWFKRRPWNKTWKIACVFKEQGEMKSI